MNTCLITGSTCFTDSPRSAPSHRNVAPAEQHLALVLDGALHLVLAGDAACGLTRQEDHAHTVLADGGKLDPLLAHFLAKQLVRDLDQDSRTIRGLRVGAHCPPVRQVAQDGQSLLDHHMRFLAFDVRHEADAAGVALVARVVQTLCGRQESLVHG